jgi:hypothetical protein
MSNTRFVLTPHAAEFPSSNFPQLQLINRRPVLSFDAATDEAAYWTAVAPQGLTGTITVTVSYIMASATTGNVIFEAAIEAISDGDSVDLDATTSFDTANSSGAVAVPGTAGYIDQFTITMTNADSIAAADYFRLSLNRDANNGSDTAAGDCHVLAVELRDDT